jgi:hypothetical protein
MPSDPPPDDPQQQAGTPTPLTTAAQLGGVAREALISSTGSAQLGGLVREALISGMGLAGTASAKSGARSPALTLTATGAVLSGTAKAKSIGRASIAVSVQLSGKLAAQSAARIGQLPTFVALAGHARGKSSGQLADLSLRILQGRALTMSRSRAAMTLSFAGSQNAVTINV